MENMVNVARELAQKAYDALDQKKGEDIRIIDISKVSIMADYFVIAHGSNANQISALIDVVEEELRKAGAVLKQREGNKHDGWVLLDFGEVIVHIFDHENRLFYDLERIWRDGHPI